MRAFISIAVVLAFLPLVASEMAMDANLASKAAEMRRMQDERIACDEFRYSAQDAFLGIAAGAVGNPDPEARHWTAACAALGEWALKNGETSVAIMPLQMADFPAAGNALVYGECALFLDVGKDAVRLGPKCDPNSPDLEECAGKLLKKDAGEAARLLAASALGRTCFVAEKEINGRPVRAVVGGAVAYERPAVP